MTLSDIKFRLIFNCLSVSMFFGYWMGSLMAGCFMLGLLGFILSAIDYGVALYKEKSE